MKIFKTKHADLHISEDIFEQEIFNNGTPQKFYEEEIGSLFNKFKKTKIKEYCDLYGKLKNLERYAILDAHGGSDGNWIYQDGEKVKPIQKWINSVDGKYSSLILNTCNPGGHTPKSKKSLLVLPYVDLGSQGSLINIFSGSGRISTDLIFPYGKKGKEINSYTFDYELNELREKINSK